MVLLGRTKLGRAPRSIFNDRGRGLVGFAERRRREQVDRFRRQAAACADRWPPDSDDWFWAWNDEFERLELEDEAALLAGSGRWLDHRACALAGVVAAIVSGVLEALARGAQLPDVLADPTDVDDLRLVDNVIEAPDAPPSPPVTLAAA